LILDCTCGPRSFWFDKNDSRVIFADKRMEQHDLKDSSSVGGFRSIEIKPNILLDFSSMPFKSDSFDLVIFDPPHLEKNGATGWLAKKYGKLLGNWTYEIERGFSECFRVLRPNGTLIFKWNEWDIPISNILVLTNQKPLFGHKCGRQSKTHWIVFQK